MESNEPKTKCFWQAEKEAFEAIAKIGSYEAMTEEERNRYDDAQRHYWDSVAVYQAAIKEGKKEGEHTCAVKMALSLIKQGFDNDMIGSTTELPEAEIEKLREKRRIE